MTPLLDFLSEVLEHILKRPGWRELFAHHGLHLDSADLSGELSKPLPKIDRRLPGFEDFSHEGHRAIEPNIPSRSLLYHALASPAVRAFKDRPLQGPDLLELDTIENYIFGIDPPSLEALQDKFGKLAICTFACEYRSASETSHGKHADLCFSRTGIARVGVAEPLYDAAMRGFSGWNQESKRIPVVPCRYAAYLAARVESDEWEGIPSRRRKSDVTKKRRFFTPVHKLFAGAACLRGADALTLQCEHLHVNEKLRRIHLALMGSGINTRAEEPDLSDPPYRVTAGLVDVSPIGASTLIAPVPHTDFAEPVQTKGGPLSFPVRKGHLALGSFRIPSRPSDARSAPEFTDARQPATGNPAPDTAAMIEAAGYDAIHYRDRTADGYLRLSSPELEKLGLKAKAAYSIVAAPDFLPGVSQQTLSDWFLRELPPSLRHFIWDSAVYPRPLSDERLPANLTLRRLHSSGGQTSVFSDRDTTMTAVVGMPLDRLTGTSTPPRGVSQLRSSSLPDSAAGLFAPGWDISFDRTETARSQKGVSFLAGHGLGSPFLEDSRLCAALSSFWPAATPDTSRSFGLGTFATVTPFTDDEIGLNGNPSWDGAPPPKITPQRVEFLNYHYVDYLRPGNAARFDLSLVARLDGPEFTARTGAMARVYAALGLTVQEDRAKLALLKFVPARAGDLHESGLRPHSFPAYRLTFARLHDPKTQIKKMNDNGFRFFDRDPATELEVVVSSHGVAIHQNGSWSVRAGV